MGTKIIGKATTNQEKTSHLRGAASIPLAAYRAYLSMPVLTLFNALKLNKCVAELTGSSLTQTLEIATATAPKALVRYDICIWILSPSFSANSK